MNRFQAIRYQLALALIVSFALFAGSCGKDEPDAQSSAYRITNRAQLIGGPTALGDVGDYKLENDQIRVIVQNLTFNRGSGVFGGSLIDADLRRFDERGNALGGTGQDNFGELFPVFFLEMIDPQNIEIINDGTDGEAAIIEVSGRGGEFVTMLRYLNQLMVNSYEAEFNDIVEGLPANSDGQPLMEFSTRYILEPGARHVRIESTMRNISTNTLEFPSQSILALLQQFLGLDLSDFRIPTGHVLGFGNLSDIFIPGVGYDLRFGLEEAYETSVPLPGFPGLLTDVVASSTDLGVNYGFATEPDPDTNFVYQRDQSGLYGGEAEPDDLLFLFYASGFGGVFSSQSPTELAPSFCKDDSGELLSDAAAACASKFTTPDDVTACEANFDTCVQAALETPSEYTFTNYFIVGDGDVASIQEEVRSIRGEDAQLVRGRVVDGVTREAIGPRGSVLFYTVDGNSCANPRIYSQVHTSSSGIFQLELEPGAYCYRVHASGYPLGPPTRLDVDSDVGFVTAEAPGNSRVQISVTDQSGQPVPAKISVVGTHEYRPGELTREFLFDLSAGEPWRATDLVEDEADDPSTRRFLEATAFGDARGRISVAVRPGNYTLIVSRGSEYNLWEKEITLKPGQTATANAVIERVVDTPGYLSGDYHLHARGSIDSGLDNNVRVLSAAGEGLEVAVATDHNYVTDYRPFILNNDLQDWMNSVVGLELTTFEAGHFNAFPIQRTLDTMSRGSIKWQEVPPGQIFSTLREMAPDSGTIIQVNHPRTPILGYFYQHNVDPFDSTVDLALNEADPGLGQITATLTSPSGPAFIETVQDENGDVLEYKSTFSWDFDAIEVFNGKHLEEVRHFRMPFDKNAPETADDSLPDSVRDGLTEILTADARTEEGEFSPSFVRELFPDLSTAERNMLTETQIEERLDEWVFEQIPEKNAVLCDGDDIVFAGGLDDWYNILNRPRPDGSYRAYTATGNSDAHGAYLDEVGFPRNYFWTGHDEPRNLKSEEIVSALQSHRNIVTNGPFVTLEIDGEPIGSEIQTTSGTVAVEIHIAAADWVGADRFRLVANGEVVKGLSPDQTDDYWGWVPIELDDGVYRETFVVDVQQDTWFVVEVEGDQNMFPVLTPQEIPPFNFDAVIGSLAGAFGFGAAVEGLEPNLTFALTPLAFTNPIWVITDGDGEFTPPSPPVMRCVDGEFTNPNALRSIDELVQDKSKRLHSAQLPIEMHHKNPLKRPKGKVTRDLRMIFENFGHIH